MHDHDIAYVTIDIGANDLLGHIYSPDCEQSLDDAACRQRIGSVLAAYEASLDRILHEITDAADGATIVFLGTYNPFSIGFGAAVPREEQSDDVTMRLNAVARRVAEAHDVLYADGFTPLQGTAGATTHMLDASPDIHPLAIGYDALASAIVDVLP